MKSVTTLLLLATVIFAKGQEGSNELPVPLLVFDSKKELIISPSSTSSKIDFDFFIGKWKLHNKVMKKKADNTIEWNEFESTQEMHTILNGNGNIDNFIAERNGK